MTDDRKVSRGWRTVAIVAVLASAVLIWKTSGFLKELATRDGADSVQFQAARKIVTEYIQRSAVTDSLLEVSENSRAGLMSIIAIREKSWEMERKGYRQALGKVNTKTATVKDLDSTHMSMYGPADSDSVHTIPLDYSRKLTGDALRYPIMERLAFRTQERLDSAQSHYGRVVDSYRLDVETLKQDREAAEGALNGVMKQVGDMQGELNNQERQFKRQRRLERIVEGAIVVGVIILSL